MTSNRSPLLAVMLAVAMVLVTVPLAPSGNAQSSDAPAANQCRGQTQANSNLPHRERGYIMLSHPDTADTRVSQSLYLQVFSDGTEVQGISAQRWTNGIDAYVVDMNCIANGNENYCLEHRDNLSAVRLVDGQHDAVSEGDRPDVRIQFYDNLKNPVDDVHDPAVEDGSSDVGDVPDFARYAVLYLENGHPVGIQTEQGQQIWGIYTLNFKFTVYESLDVDC